MTEETLTASALSAEAKTFAAPLTPNVDDCVGTAAPTARYFKA